MLQKIGKRFRIMTVVSKQCLLIIFSQVGKNRVEVLEMERKVRYDASVKDGYAET